MAQSSSSLFDLTGKVALVTGARTGLGQAMSVALAMAGAHIVGLGSRPMPETRQRVVAHGQVFSEVNCDLVTCEDFGAIVSRCVDDFGGIDILVNNAGIIRRSSLLDASTSDWDAVMTVNLRCMFLLSQAVAAHMSATRRQGRIINIASLLSFQGGIRVAAYAASKHGVAGLTRAMANELAPLGITVNAIAPGYMATDNTEALRLDEVRNREILGRMPVGRWGEPEDLATAVLFLASPASSYVTGAIVPVDGGWLAR